MSLNTFKLPRKPIASRKPGRAVKGPIEVIPPAPLDNWHKGFSNKAAQDHITDDLGLQPVARPDYEVSMPNDLTAISSMELGTLHARYVAYVQWIEEQMALADSDAREDAAYQEHIAADVRLRKHGTVQDKTAKAINDVRFIAAEQASLVSTAKAKLLRVRVSGYERLAQACSREMSRRTPGRTE